ncbi:hypothetical protein KR067_010582, partial [Drosophila pandora]
SLPHKWVPMILGPNASPNTCELPQGVVQCGTDDEGNTAYVARVIKGRELLPASYVPAKKAALASTCHVAYWITEDVEVLVLENCHPKWIAGQFGKYPPDALETGYSDTGEVTYTGRSFFKGSLRIGKVHPSFMTMFVAHNHQEKSVFDYEVLSLPYKWVPMNLGPNAPNNVAGRLPHGVIQCGTDDEGHEAYVARVSLGRELLPASYVPTKQAALASTSRVAYWLTEDIEVLVCENCHHRWVAGQLGKYPPDALETGYSDTGEVTYTGRAIFKGSLRIGRVHPSFVTMFIGHNHEERIVSHYEVLVIT